jgi:hypothetical protein
LSGQTSFSEKAKGNIVMANNKHEHRTAVFEDGTHAVLRFDPTEPHRMELIATFYEAVHAQDYVRLHTPAGAHQEKKPRAVTRAAKRAPKPASAAQAAQAPEARSKPQPAAAAKPKRTAEVQAKPASAAKAADTAVTERQTAVLKALRSLMDKQHRVEAKTAELAKASSVPLGSLHSILVSLEKKHLIKTERPGSPKHPAIYQVLETSRKATSALNGAIHRTAAPAEATAS